MDAVARTLWRVRRKQPVFSMQINSKFLIFRLVLDANPVTLIRKWGCAENHVDTFHALVEFSEVNL